MITTVLPPQTQVVAKALATTQDCTVKADLMFLESWEVHPNRRPGLLLRAQQVRRANPDLAEALRREVSSHRAHVVSAEPECDYV